MEQQCVGFIRITDDADQYRQAISERVAIRADTDVADVKTAGVETRGL